MKRNYQGRVGNDNLEFLNNPFSRPCGFVEESNNKNKEEVPQSMATASRLANLHEKDDKFVGEIPELMENNDNLNEKDNNGEFKPRFSNIKQKFIKQIFTVH